MGNSRADLDLLTVAGVDAQSTLGVAAVQASLAAGNLGSTSNTAVRQGLHDLSNTLTGLLGNLELVEMSVEDAELDHTSLELALAAAREALMAVRSLKSECGC